MGTLIECLRLYIFRIRVFIIFCVYAKITINVGNIGQHLILYKTNIIFGLFFLLKLKSRLK